MHVEHRHYVCEICHEVLPSLKSFKQHPNSHGKLEYDLCQDRWAFEIEFEKLVEHECWVKTMVLDSAVEIKKIGNKLEDIVTMISGDVMGLTIDETTSPLFIKLKDLIARLDYEEKYLIHYANVDGTVTQFAKDVKIHKPPKYRPDLPPRSDWLE